MGKKELGFCFCSDGFPVLSIHNGDEIGVFRDKHRQRYGIGEYALISGLGDSEFKILSFNGTDKYNHKYKVVHRDYNDEPFWVNRRYMYRPGVGSL